VGREAALKLHSFQEIHEETGASLYSRLFFFPSFAMSDLEAILVANFFCLNLLNPCSLWG